VRFRDADTFQVRELDVWFEGRAAMEAWNAEMQDRRGGKLLTVDVNQTEPRRLYLAEISPQAPEE
jgi:hypothetical protein